MRSPFLAKMCAAALMLTFCLFSASEQSLAQLCRGKLMGKSACGCNECQQPTPAPAAASCGCDSCQSAPAASCGCGDTACGDASCSGSNFGDGAPCGMKGFKLPSFAGLRGKFSGGAGNCDSGNCGGGGEMSCGGECGGGCDSCSGGSSRFVSKMARGPATGMSIFSRGSACGGDSCGGCDSCRGGRLKGKLAAMKPAGRMAARGSCGVAGCTECDDQGTAGMAVGGRLGGHLGGGKFGGGCGRGGCGIGGRLCGACQAGLGLRNGLGHRISPGDIPHTAQPPYPGHGGMAPTYAYPYYTTRGPRDFLMDNPPTIGW